MLACKDAVRVALKGPATHRLPVVTSYKMVEHHVVLFGYGSSAPGTTSRRTPPKGCFAHPSAWSAAMCRAIRDFTMALASSRASRSRLIRATVRRTCQRARSRSISFAVCISRVLSLQVNPDRCYCSRLPLECQGSLKRNLWRNMSLDSVQYHSSRFLK